MENRTYIIGGLGSGKSFFSKQLSEKAHTECFDLDRVVFIGSGFEEKTAADRDSALQSILQREKWIIEGTYTEGWILPALERADRIIYLTTPFLIRLFRFIKRIVNQGVLSQRGLWGRTKLVLGFKYREWDRTHSKYEQILKPFKEKVTTLSSTKEVKKFLNSL